MNIVKFEFIVLFCLMFGGVWLVKWLVVMLLFICYISEVLQEEGFIFFNGGFVSVVCEVFSSFLVLIFIGVIGIVVWVLVLLVNDKFSDLVVVVIDECVWYVISLFFGYVGGVNVLICYFVGMFDVDLVIIIVIDVNELVVFDMLVFQLNVWMIDFCVVVKIVNQMLVSGKWVGLWCDGEFIGVLSCCDWCGFILVSDLVSLLVFDVLICVILCWLLLLLLVFYWKLVFQWVVVGIGCWCDIFCVLFCMLLDCQFVVQCFDLLVLKVIGSVSLKVNELGLCQLVYCCWVLFEIFSVEVLCEYEYCFLVLFFVWEMVGVGSVFGLVVWLLSQGNLFGEILCEQGVIIILGVIY